MKKIRTCLNVSHVQPGVTTRLRFSDISACSIKTFTDFAQNRKIQDAKSTLAI